MTSHHSQAFIRIVFYCPTSARFTRRFPWHVLSKQRSCPLIAGFSSIRTWVTQPRHQLRRLGDERVLPSWWGRIVSSAHIKGQGFTLFHPRLLPPLLVHSRTLELQRPSPHFLPQPSPTMSEAGGKWMVSSVTEGHIKKLRGAGYLSDDIAHRLPDAGQFIPTPRPHERVVFL